LTLGASSSLAHLPGWQGLHASSGASLPTASGPPARRALPKLRGARTS
jgi:hypothetical protein